MRHLILAIAAFAVTACASAVIYRSPLNDTRWRLVELRLGDDPLQPAEGDLYQLTFTADGGLSMQLDCNRGAGTWTSRRDDEISITPLAVTRAFCGETSLDTRVAQALSQVRAYDRDGEQLTLETSDGALVLTRVR